MKISAQTDMLQKSHTHRNNSTTLTDGSELDCWNIADLKSNYHGLSLVPLTAPSQLLLH